MEKKRTKVVVSVLALAGLVAFSVMGYAGSLEPAAAPGPTMKTLDEVEPRVAIHASDLPLTITMANSYYLVEDISFADTLNHAITIECDDVTIDLMGYTIKGPDSGNKSGIYMNGRTNVEICNGTVRDFGENGISEASVGGKEHRVIRVRAISNGVSGLHLWGYAHLVKQCTAADNGSYGIYALTGCTVTGNIAYNNQWTGIRVSVASTVRDNTVYNNQGYGITAGDGCTVTGNTAHSNQVHGILAYDGCTVTGNTAYNNVSSGIYANTGCTIISNTAYSNDSDGILCLDGGTVTDNTAYNNQLRGIFAFGNDCMVSGNTTYSNESIGICVGNGCTVTGNMAYDNNLAGIWATDGSMVTGNTVQANNRSEDADHAGIRVSDNCLVKANTLSANKRYNIRVAGSGNSIEQNLVTDCTPGNGIQVSGNSNMIIKNRAHNNTNNYIIGAGNAYGQIKNVAGGGSFSNTDPTANFEF